MANAITAVLDLQDGRVSRLSWEALEAARQLGSLLSKPVDAILLGSAAESAAGEVAAHPLRRVVCAANQLDAYTPDGYCAALSQLLADAEVSHIILPHSYQVREFAPKIAVHLNRPFLSDCIGFRREGDDVVFSRQLYQGKLVADVVFEGPAPYFVSIQAGSFPPSLPGQGGANATIESIPLNLESAPKRSTPLERVRESQKTVDLGQSDIIVAVGRGIKEAENLPLLERLAQALGGQLAGSRPICDNGWLPMERQVGSSGQTVAPKLYFAVGISGAIQHLVGMKGSRKVVAINKDPHAPIFEVADIGIVANLFDVVPAITEEALRIRQQ